MCSWSRVDDGGLSLLLATALKSWLILRSHSTPRTLGAVGEGAPESPQGLEEGAFANNGPPQQGASHGCVGGDAGPGALLLSRRLH